MATFGVPGLVVAAVHADGPVDHLALGVDGHGRAIDLTALFPVASLTTLATALAVLRLGDGGRLHLDDPLGRYFPEAAAAVSGVSVRRLLCHASGLPLDLANAAQAYRAGLTWPRIAAACLATPPVLPPGTRVQYSNVGYGILAALVERLVGDSFPNALATLVLRPLGLEAFLGHEPPRPVAALTDLRSRHAGTDLEPFNTPFWRSLALPWGGLITNADGALALVRAFRAGHSPWRASTVAEATRNQTDDLPGGFVPPLVWPVCWWGLGPDLRDAKAPHWTPAEASPRTYGHAGESGSLAYDDPAADVAWVILGSRTAYNGWLLRRGPAIGAAALAAYRV